MARLVCRLPALSARDMGLPHSPLLNPREGFQLRLERSFPLQDRKNSLGCFIIALLTVFFF